MDLFSCETPSFLRRSSGFSVAQVAQLRFLEGEISVQGKRPGVGSLDTPKRFGTDREVQGDQFLFYPFSGSL